MRLLRLSCLLILLFITPLLKAQVSFSHSVGGGFIGGKSFLGVNLLYSPRVNLFHVGAEGTFSVGTNLALGFGGDIQGHYAQGSGFIIDAPLVAALNLGHAADADSWSGFGGFVGAGLGVNHIDMRTYLGQRAPTNFGLYFNGGIRFLTIGPSFTLQGSYLLNFVSGGCNVIGVSSSYNIGYWE